MNILIILITALTFLMPSYQGEFVYDDDTQMLFPGWEIFYSPLDRLLPQNYTLINNCKFNLIPNIMNILCGDNCTEIPKGLNISALLFKIQITHIKKIYKNDFTTEISSLTALEIEGNINLKYLEPGCFKYFTNLQNLTITSNPNLSYLDEDVFSGLINLKRLCISKNGFAHVIDVTRACSARNLPKLKLLDFAEHTFHEVGEHEFLPMNGTKLNQLNLILCQIKQIHANTLLPLKNLTQLRLCQNLFNRTTVTNLIVKTVQSGITIKILNLFQIGLRRISPFRMLEVLGKTTLNSLILSSNTFNNIENGWFPPMPNLLSLDLRLCLIVNIEEDAFNNVTNLEYLRLGGNRFTEFPTAVTKLKHLDKLEMTAKFDEHQSSVIFNIPDGSFKQLTNLTSLELSYKNLGSISKNLFTGARKLMKLSLKNTSLCYIEDGAFSHLPNLKYLNLINNPLLQAMPLTSEVFRGLKNLNYLLLGGCTIKNLTANTSIFMHLESLTYLGLERNDIIAINKHQLRHLHCLKELQLPDNQLAPWNERILPGPNLKLLNANQNKFSFITTAMLEDWQHLDTLYLQDNPLICDCSLYPVVKWLHQNSMSLKQKRDDYFITNCVAPEEWRHKSITEYLEVLGTSQDSICEIYLSINKALILILITGIVIIVFASAVIYLNRWHMQYWIFLFRLNFKKHNPWKRHKNVDNKNIPYYDAFVSYSKTDRLFVMQMINELENDEQLIKLCIYERDFIIGSSISQEILQNIASSRRTILVVSNDFVKSNWCQWESQLAEYHHLFFHEGDALGPDDTLLIIKFANLQMKSLSPTLKYLLKTRIYLQWDPQDQNKQREFWQKLKMVIALPKGHLKYNK